MIVRLLGLIALQLGLMACLAGGAQAAWIDLHDTAAAEQTSRQSLGRFLHLYQDHSGRMTLSDIAALDARGEMQPAGVDVPSLGYQAGATWVRFDLRNTSAHTQTRWLYLNWPFQQHYNLYLTDAAGNIEVMRSGASIAKSERPLASRYFLFPLRLDAGEQVRAYLQITGKASHIIDLEIWQPVEFLDHMAWRMAWIYLCVGSTLIILIFSGLTWHTHRRLGLLALIPAHVLTIFLLFGLHGFHVDWLPASEENWAGLILNFCAALALFLHAQFARSFLNLAARFPRLDRAFNVALWLILACVGVFFLLRLIPPMLLASLVLLGLLSLFAFWAVWRGGVNDIGYLAAWGLLFLAFIVRNAQNFGWLTDSGWVGNLPLLGLLSSVVVLSLTLLRDILATRKSHEAAQQQLIRQQQSEQARLARAVEERTAELRQALADVEAASRAKSVFLSSMSHELRTPLHAVLGFSELARENADGETRDRIEIIERNGRQLLRLIDDLLSFSRDETSRMTLHPEAVSLAPFIEHVRQQGERMAAESGNQFRLACDNGLPAALAMDEARLMQILANLLSNACKYTQAGLVRLRITPLAEDAPDTGMWRLKFEVIDNGPGIDAADQQRIFEPFVRLDASAMRPGMGLGLGIARQWIRAMGGDLQLDSTPGVGSCFSFSLRLPEAAPPLPAAAPAALPQEVDTLPAAQMDELRSLLDAGRLPALRRNAQALIAEHPQSRAFLLQVETLCSRVDLPGLRRLLLKRGINLEISAAKL